jgi:uncharacterized protein involved in type VI secretion and phage assembly
LEGPIMQKWRKGLRPKTAATRQSRNKGPRRQMITIREQEEGSCDRHRRVKLKTAITPGEKRTGLQDPQELEFVK